MKKTLLFVAMMLCCAMTMFAQNDKISYQAVVRDTENKLVANKSVEVTVNIYNGTATTAAYTETQTVTTNLNGLISLQIGPNGTNANWNSIEWNQARIETTVKLNGTQLGTLAMPLTAVPYAMYAKYADNVDPDALAAQMHDTANNVRGEMNNKLADKANVADVYTKAQTNVNIHDTADVVRAEITALSNNYYTKTQVNNLAEQYIQQLTNTLNTLNARIDSVINVMNNLPTRMVEQRDTVQTAGQTSFTLAHEARADCVVRMYINGVMVGGNYNDVVTVSNTTVTYDPTKNGNYALKADDKVTIVYWY